METNKKYYILYEETTKTFDLIDCTKFDVQPIVKSFKYETSAIKYHNKLRNKK